MSSLTIRIDEKTNQQLELLAKASQLTKSTIVRNSLLEYLAKQIQNNDFKQKLREKITVSDIDTVRTRLAQAEAGEVLSDEDYEIEMESFFKQELGILR